MKTASYTNYEYPLYLKNTPRTNCICEANRIKDPPMEEKRYHARQISIFDDEGVNSGQDS